MAEMRVAGTYITNTRSTETFKAYIPNPLPPDPPLNLNGEHFALLDKATLALGRLDGLIGQLPDNLVILYTYFCIRKEAVLSSQIEGTQSTLSDLLLFENNEMPDVSLEDVGEVLRYVNAMEHGLKRIREDDFPLSLRLIREVHEILLSTGRGSDKTPGEFRNSQNWIGGSRPGNARYVPPPPGEVVRCMGSLEKFIHQRDLHIQILVKVALIHAQFEIIHPFLDGNGRVGRLLITLMLCAEDILQRPLLYLSLYFKQHREAYYDLLHRIRTEGDWERWIHFFLTGVYETANQAFQIFKRILELFQNDRQLVEKSGRSIKTTLQILELLRTIPLLSIARASQATHLSAPTVAGSFNRLQQLGIVYEITSKQRHKVYRYEKYLQLLDEGTELGLDDQSPSPAKM